MNASELRAEFPVLAQLAYLNAGTDGPLPARAARASEGELARELAEGRAGSHRERKVELADALRAAYARALGCEPRDVSLTTSTSEGMAQVITGMPLAPGDEILTGDDEHPGLLGLLAAARELRGAVVREVPLAQIHSALGPRTALVACSHVSWHTGATAPPELAELEVPVLLDGAQGVGAVPVDVAALGCDAYAGAGQKWLCGPDGSGTLYVSPELRERLAVHRRGYENMHDANAGLDGGVKEDGRRFDTPSLSAEALACSLASIELLEEAGWAEVHGRARSLAEQLASALAELGRPVVPRDPTTLVSFHSEDPVAERALLAESGIVVRNIPGRPWLRASVGAWNDETDIDRLLRALKT